MTNHETPNTDDSNPARDHFEELVAEGRYGRHERVITDAEGKIVRRVVTFMPKIALVDMLDAQLAAEAAAETPEA